MKTIALTVLILLTATACYAQQVPMNINPAKADRLKLILNCNAGHPTSTSCDTDAELIKAFQSWVGQKVEQELRRFDSKTDRTAGKTAEKLSRDTRTPDYDDILQ